MASQWILLGALKASSRPTAMSQSARPNLSPCEARLMMPAEIIIAPHGGSGRSGWLRSILLAGVVRLAISAVAFAGGDGAGDGLVIRLGGAELRSASPREAGKVPVVLVHGLLGSPGNWSVMIDRLTADPSVRERFQFLTFGYDSLQPIPESGRELLDALSEARRRCDPEGRDDSFDRVVLVGCSLGGLVAKAAAARAPDPQCARSSGPPPDGQGRPAAPRVGRAIFVATPHRGTPVDRGVVRSVGAWLARALSPATAARQEGGDADALCSPTSVDQLTWDHPLLRDLERAGVAAGVPSHSIIAALREPSAEGATDGLVPVASARLGGARSEVLVRAPHACFQHPEVIREVRRILGEHAAEPARPPRPAPGASPPAAGYGIPRHPELRAQPPVRPDRPALE